MDGDKDWVTPIELKAVDWSNLDRFQQLKVWSYTNAYSAAARTIGPSLKNCLLLVCISQLSIVSLGGGPQWASPLSQSSKKNNAQNSPGLKNSVDRRSIDLTPGRKIQRVIAGGERHEFSILIGSAALIRISLIQNAIDLKLSFLKPDGRLATESDSPAGPFGLETLSRRINPNRSYKLVVQPTDDFAIHGSYEILLETLTMPTTAQRTREAYEARIAAGRTSQMKGGPEYTRAAIVMFKQAQALLKTSPDRYEEANTFHRIAKSHQSLKEWGAAEENFDRALAIRREIGDSQGESYTLMDMAVLYRNSGKTEKAHQTYQKAIAVFQDLGNKSGQASAYYGIGFMYANQFRMNKALEFYDPALKIRREINDRHGESRTLNAMGGALEVLGHNSKAMDLYQQAMLGWREMGDQANEANTENNIALIYDYVGRWQRAIESYSRAIAIYDALRRQDAKTRRMQALAHANLGVLYLYLADIPKAQSHFDIALPILHEIDDARGEAFTLTWIGYARYLQNDFDGALKFYNQALGLQQKSNDPKRFDTHTMMGMAHTAREEYSLAAGQYQNALTLLENPDGNSIVGLGIVYDKMGQLLQLTGEKEKSFDYFEKALQIWEKIENYDGKALTLYNLAQAKSKLDENLLAEDYIDRALDTVELLRTNVAEQHLRMMYFTSKSKFYETAIDIKMRLNRLHPGQGYDAKALRTAERGRARVLLESLTEARANLRQGADPELIAKERDLSSQISAGAQRLLFLKNDRQSGALIAEVEKQVDDLRSEIRAINSKILQQSPRYGSLSQPQPLTLSEIQRLVLDDDTILLSYALGEDRSYLWVVTKTSLSSFELLPRREIEAAALELVGQISRQQLIPEDKYQKSARRLGDMILAPAAGLLKKSRLLVVADGALHYTPFSVLPSPGKSEFKALIWEHEIVNLPSATTIAIMRNESAGRTIAPKWLAVLADPVFSATDRRVAGIAGQSRSNGQQRSDKKTRPNAHADLAGAGYSARGAGSRWHAPTLRDIGLISKNGVIKSLPESSIEAEEIYALAPADGRLKVTGFEANLQTAQRADLGSYRIIHFATHGILDDKRPELSGLLLSMVDEKGRAREGVLGLDIVYNLNLPVELVVLSACQTGLGKEVKGEGLQGLARGFMYAGASRVVSSLWKVEDWATRELMTHFYRKMLSDGHAPSMALREAQKEMMRKKNTSAPFFWGAFTIQGEWRKSW